MLDRDDAREAVPAVLVARRNEGQVAFGRQTGRLARPDPHRPPAPTQRPGHGIADAVEW